MGRKSGGWADPQLQVDHRVFFACMNGVTRKPVVFSSECVHLTYLVNLAP